MTDLTQTSAEVNWATTISTTAGSVQWIDEATGTCPTSPWTWTTGRPTATASTQVPYGTGTIAWGYNVNGVKEYQNSAKLTGLVAGHTYCYAVFSTKTKSGLPLLTSPAYQQLTTLSAPNPVSTGTVSFDVIGDTGENFASNTGGTYAPFSGSPTLNPYESRLYSQIGADGSRFLVGVGDTSYSGGTQNTFGDLTHTGTAAQANVTNGTEYSNIFGPTYLPLAKGIPTYLADGNHGQNNYAVRFFPAQATAAASGGTYAFDSYGSVNGTTAAQYPDDWYAFSTGNVRIYVLDASWPDANLGAGTQYSDDDAAHWKATSPQMVWLKRDLAAAPAGMTKLAVFHYPLQSDSTTEGSDTFLQQDLEPVLVAGGVRMAFNAHNHTYQRFIPTTPGQIPSYVVGGEEGCWSRWSRTATSRPDRCARP